MLSAKSSRPPFLVAVFSHLVFAASSQLDSRLLAVSVFYAAAGVHFEMLFLPRGTPGFPLHQVHTNPVPFPCSISSAHCPCLPTETQALRGWYCSPHAARHCRVSTSVAEMKEHACAVESHISPQVGTAQKGKDLSSHPAIYKQRSSAPARLTERRLCLNCSGSRHVSSLLCFRASHFWIFLSTTKI